VKRAFFFSCVAGILLLVVPPYLQAQQGGYMTAPTQIQTPQRDKEIEPPQIQAPLVGVNFGNLSVLPGIALQSIYDDNIFLKNGRQYADPQQTLVQKKESDLVNHVKPGVLFNYIMPERGYVNLGYQGDFVFYRDNTNNNWKNNQGNFDVSYDAPGGLILGVNELFAKKEDPYGSADQYQIGRVTKRAYNDLKTKIGYRLMANFRSLLYYNNYTQKYDNSIFDFTQNYTDTEYGVGMESRFLPRTWGFLRYHYGTRQYNTLGPAETTDQFNADAKWHRVNTGMTWDAGAKLSGELNLGYQWRKYDHQFTDALQTAQREDTNTWIAATSINYIPTEGTNIAVNLSRAIRATASNTNEQFVDTAIGFNLSQRILYKLTLSAGLTYGKNQYNLPVGNERTDTNYLANVSMDYNIQPWLGIGIGYRYNRKDSNIETNEYIVNQVMATVNIVL
jgi:hypothetical protein